MRRFVFRQDEIVELCRGKRVLHLGFVHHAETYGKRINEGTWLHKMIADVAVEIVGIDYLEAEVTALRQQYGYECITGDVTNLGALNLQRKFDVIVCGELIEHLVNAGLMLEGVKQYMDGNAVLVVTTPNPWSKRRIKLMKRGNAEKNWLNREHKCWYSYQTLKQLLEYSGYKEVMYGFYVGESRQHHLLRGTNGIIGKLKYLKRILALRATAVGQSDGLFFVAAVGHQQSNL